jgi:hypothetical protein
MKGDGYGNAMPGRTITPNEAVTMVLRAIGYTDNASVLVGQWPANYVSLGQSLNLYAKVASDTNMNKASAAQMVYNVLTKQLVQVDANSTVKYLYDSDAAAAKEQTLLTTGLNCEKLDKRVVTYGDAAKSSIDLLQSVGAYGVLYRNKADGKVVALDKVSTQFLAGRFIVEAGTVKFQTWEGVKYNLTEGAAWAQSINSDVYPGDRTTTGRAFFLNGNPTPFETYGWVDNDFSDEYFYYRSSPTDGTNQWAKLIVAAEVDGLTFTDLRSVAVWDADPKPWVKTKFGVAGEPFLYESGMYTSDSKKFNGHDFPVDNSGNVDHDAYVIVGAASIDDIKVDNVVYVYKNNDKKIARIDVGTATQSGTVTNVNLADSARTIGGTVIYEAPYNGVHFPSAGTPGNEGTALLDIYYRLYDFQLGEASKGNYAVVTGTYQATGASGSFQDLQFKIFDKTGSEVVYSLKNPFTYKKSGVEYKVYRDTSAFSATKLPGTNDRLWMPDSITIGGTPYNLAGVSGDFDNSAGDPLIEYVLSGGKIDTVTLGNSTPTIGSPSSSYSVNKAGSLITIGPNTSLLESGTLVFIENAGAYSIGSIKDLVEKEFTKSFRYIFSEDGKSVKALIVNSDDAGAQKIFVMINGISDGYNNGRIDIVEGISFADGTNAEGKTWNYTDSNLHSKSDLGTNTETNGRGRYAKMIQFSIDESGVLKGAVTLESQQDTTAPTGIELAAKPFGTGEAGTFTLELSGAAVKYASFEADTVLYKVSGGVWTANKVTSSGSFADDDSTPDLYTFLKTDPKKAGYDVIIKQ